MGIDGFFPYYFSKNIKRHLGKNNLNQGFPVWD